MVQIIEEAPRRPSFGQRLSAGIGRGLEMGSQLYQQRQKQEAMEKFFPGLSSLPPEIQKEYISKKLQGMNQLDVEKLRQHGKQDLFGKKQDFLGQILGGEQGLEGSFGAQMQEGAQKGMQQGFDPSKISDADIARAAAVDPNIARSLQHAKDVALRESREEKKLEFQKQKSSPEYKREEQLSSSLAQADVKYNQALQESAKLNEIKEKTLDRLEALNKKGVTGKPFEKILEKAGLVNLTSDGRREFAADVKNLITDIRSILGAQFTGFEFQTILNAYPSADFSQGANKAIINNLKEFQDIKKKEFEFANQLKKQNKGKLPVDFQSQVNEMVHEYALSRIPEIKKNTQKIMGEEFGITPGNILMLDPNGEPLDVSPEEVERYEALGATLP